MLDLGRACARAVLLASLACACAAASAIVPAKCTAKDAQAADALLDHLDTWASIGAIAKSFGHCNDGEIAEGISEAIVRLLVDHWDTLPALEKMIARAPALKNFVLSHIDATLDTDDLKQVEKLARWKCPARSMQLCVELANTAVRALK
jgi:hypothetical protein